MLAKLTSKNQLTLPKSIAKAIGDSEYFDVKVEGGVWWKYSKITFGMAE